MQQISSEAHNALKAQFDTFYAKYSSELEKQSRINEMQESRKEKVARYKTFCKCGVPENCLNALITDGKDIAVLCDIRARAAEFVKDVAAGKFCNMLLTGSTGTGKTYTASGMLRRLFFTRDSKKSMIDMKYGVKSFCTGLYTTSADIVESFCSTKSYKANEKSKKSSCAKYTDCNLLVIDEISREVRHKTGTNPVEQNALFYVLNERYCKSLSTVCITNMSSDAFKSFIGSAFMSRMSIGFISLDTTGVPDLRQNKGGV